VETDDTSGVSYLQFALIRIEAASPRLAPKDLPTHPDFKGGWGPFGLDNTDEFKVATYDVFIQRAVSKFQLQAMVVSDGLAGIHTLRRLDGILVAVEKLPPIGPPSPF
jgi:hypothetical protein